MVHSRTFRWLAVAIAAAVFFGQTGPTSAWAELGGDVNTVQNDAVHMKGALRSTPGASYTVHEITLPGGTLVREYVSAQGKVFAVSWKGPTLPNLESLLGTHYQQFQQAVQSRPYRIRGPVVVQSPGLVVQSAGHMRGFIGRAYLPGSFPSGIAVAEIR